MSAPPRAGPAAAPRRSRSPCAPPKAPDPENPATALWHHHGYLTDLARREIGKDLRSKGDPDDIVQETFLEACRDLRNYRGKSDAELRGWLRAILKNNARTFRKRYRDAAMRGVGREVPLEALGRCGPASDDEGADVVLRREATDVVRRAVTTLPPVQRLTVVLRVVQDKSFREIGERLGCSAPYAFKCLDNALTSLRGKLRSF